MQEEPVPDKDEKTEDASSKRKSEMRGKGQVAKSQDLTAGAGVMIALIAILIFGERLMDVMRTNLIDVYSMISSFELNEASFIALVSEKMLKKTLFAIYPIAVLMLVLAVGVNFFQVGWLFTLNKLKPDFKKVMKMNGLKSKFSISTIVELLKNLAKLTIVGIVVYIIIADEFEDLLFLIDTDVAIIWAKIFDVALEITIWVAALLIVLGMIDFAYQKRKFRTDSKMTKQELKDEAKNADQDPKLKARMRQMMMEMNSRMMQGETKRATVVITNPIFIAIAIRYERGVDDAPVIVAKGKRLIAEEIRKIATDNDIPIVEDKPLARAMYDIVEPGVELPAEFFGAVAEILAYVFSLKNERQVTGV